MTAAVLAVGAQDTPLQIHDPDDLEYLTEGAANILYRYNGPEEQYHTRLFRLRKYLPNSPTTLQLYKHLQTTFAPILSNYILETKLVEISTGVIKTLNERLGDVPDRGKGKQNDRLDESEEWGFIVEDMTPGIYQKFNLLAEQTYLKVLPHSFLAPLPPSPISSDDSMEDTHSQDAATLTKNGWRDIMTVEFKPKYLVQSPDAPHDWTLCRTCALRHMRSRSLSARSTSSMNSIESGPGVVDENGYVPPEYCPFDLVSFSPDRVRRAVESIIGRDGAVTILDEDEVIVSDPQLGENGITPWLDDLESSIVDILAEYFVDNASIVHTLASLQSNFGGTTGVLSAPTPSVEMSKEDFERMMSGHPTTGKITVEVCTAMSLRDCTVYVRLWMRKKQDGSGGFDVRIENKIGDLDMKTGEGGKGVYWRDVEKRLIRGDWYRNRGVEDVGCREPDEYEMMLEMQHLPT